LFLEDFVKQRVVLSINIVIVLALVAASALLANRWRLEGSNYSAERKADGVIERNTIVSNASSSAEINLARYVSEGEKERAVRLAAAVANAKVTEAQAETGRVRMNNESTAAQADAVRALQKKGKASTGSLFLKRY
jgi:hypothetical protein